MEEARLFPNGSEAASCGRGLTIRDLRKSFGDHVLPGVDLHVPPHALFQQVALSVKKSLVPQ